MGEAAGVAASVGFNWVHVGHDIPPDWLHKGGHNPIDNLEQFRRIARDGAAYCRNDGCEVVGHRKGIKGCPQCKDARYCGDACQKQDWTTGGHKATCCRLSFCKGSAPAQAEDV